MHTTPATISRQVAEFCASISDETPSYVPVKPIRGAPPSNCFGNVEWIVDAHGGSPLHGWMIWETPSVLIEAEAHAIWVMPSGLLVDITPKQDSESEILFLPDRKLIWPGPYYANRRLFLNDDAVSREAKAYYEDQDRKRAATWNGRSW